MALPSYDLPFEPKGCWHLAFIGGPQKRHRREADWTDDEDFIMPAEELYEFSIQEDLGDNRHVLVQHAYHLYLNACCSHHSLQNLFLQ